jgi:hypothetical protein
MAHGEYVSCRPCLMSSRQQQKGALGDEGRAMEVWRGGVMLGHCAASNAGRVWRRRLHCQRYYPYRVGPTPSTTVPTITGHTMGIATRQTLLGMRLSVHYSLLHFHLRHIALTAPPNAILADLLAPPRGTLPQWFPSSRQEEDSRIDK